MIKSFKNIHIRKLILLLLVIASTISSNSFAAVISDNDGSAFVTKGEFDAIKFDFNEQIEEYNASIDNKIDGAIAEYLASLITASTTQIVTPVTNYRDIRWMNAYYRKAERRKYTGQKTWTTSSGWFAPYFGSWRVLRQPRLMLLFGMGEDVNGALVRLSLNNDSSIRPIDKGVVLDSTGHIFAGYDMSSYTMPWVRYVEMFQNTDGDYTINSTSAAKLNAEYRAQDAAFGSFVDVGASKAPFLYEGAFQGGLRTDASSTATFNSTTGDEYLNVSIKALLKSADPKYWERTIRITPKNFNLGVLRDNISVVGASFSADISENFWLKHDPTMDIIAEKETSANNAINDKNLDCLMLGDDSSSEWNVAYRRTDVAIGHAYYYDFSTAITKPIEFLSNTIDVYSQTISNITSAGHNITIAGSGFSASKVQINYPLWPKEKEYNLRNNKFRYRDKALKLGQGIPLSDRELLKNTTVRLKLEYDVIDSETGSLATGANAQDVHFSLKKGDYLPPIDDSLYYEDVDGNKIKQKVFSGGKIEMGIPIKSDGDMWLRIGTNDKTAHGKYVKIKNIDAKLITE